MTCVRPRTQEDGHISSLAPPRWRRCRETNYNRNARFGAGKRRLPSSEFLIPEVTENPQRLGHLLADYPQLRSRDVSVSFCQRQDCLKNLI